MTFDKRRPVTLLTGFLGAGKTTLLNQLLNQSDIRLAIVVNEFGDVGIDGGLITQSDDVLELTNGCICCTVRTDLVDVFTRLKPQMDRIEGVVIETTGVAEPGPVIQTLDLEDVRDWLRLDACVTTVDCANYEHSLSLDRVVQHQVEAADVVILNKVDLVTQNEVAKVKQLLLEVNDTARYVEASFGDVDLEVLTGIPRIVRAYRSSAQHHSSFESIAFERPVAINSMNIGDLTGAIEQIEGLYRTKGILWLDDSDDKILLHGVGGRLRITDEENPWGEESRSTKVVFIGQKLDPKPLAEALQEAAMDDEVWEIIEEG